MELKIDVIAVNCGDRNKLKAHRLESASARPIFTTYQLLFTVLGPGIQPLSLIRKLGPRPYDVFLNECLKQSSRDATHQLSLVHPASTSPLHGRTNLTSSLCSAHNFPFNNTLVFSLILCLFANFISLFSTIISQQA